MSAPAASLPLIDGFGEADAVFAWRRGQPISCATFVADVERLARRLPDRGHVLNVCTDRYRFSVGVGAALVRGQISLMPPTTHAALVQQLKSRFPDAYCLAEEAQPGIDLMQLSHADEPGAPGAVAPPDRPSATSVPSIPADRTVAYVFTSGSTGAPVPHRKRFGALVRNVRAEAERLGCAAGGPPVSIVATVPPQHMYGFESSVVIAWQNGAALVAERPFYPADVAAALAGVPGRKLLVTTPFHLRALVTDGTELPRLEQIVCATAPLSRELAVETERRFGAPVVEIYGCTETGQLATRRPTVDACWRPFRDVVVEIAPDGTARAHGGHIESPNALGDILAPADDFAASGRFSLVGRSADLVNIAGKRTSLAALGAHLNAIDGVVDGVFCMPADDAAARDGVTRLIAVVVAPTLDARRLLAALRERIDPVFLPRPVYFVDRLPRNTTGKLTRDVLDAVLASGARRHDAPADGGGTARR